MTELITSFKCFQRPHVMHCMVLHTLLKVAVPSTLPFPSSSSCFVRHSEILPSPALTSRQKLSISTMQLPKEERRIQLDMTQTSSTFAAIFNSEQTRGCPIIVFLLVL